MYSRQDFEGGNYEYILKLCSQVDRICFKNCDEAEFKFLESVRKMVPDKMNDLNYQITWQNDQFFDCFQRLSALSPSVKNLAIEFKIKHIKDDFSLE